MKFVLTRQAEEDLIEIYLYGLNEFGPIQAKKYHNSLKKAFERIAENHKMFSLGTQYL
jgi:toxin ParE1/3/4